MIKYLILALLVALAVVSAAPPAPPKAKYDMKDVFVYKNKIMVEGKEFYVKGFNYSPQPLGMEGILANDGGGLCSQKRNNKGVPQSACFLEDYFDGIVHPDFPEHGPWFRQIWDRDFSLMKSMGVNAVRVYHMHYVTKTLLDKYPTLYSDYDYNLVSDHVPFFDAAHEYGIKVICPVTDTETVLTTYTMDELKRFVEARVDEVGNHPALLMWTVGNELGLYMKPGLRAIVNELMDYLREYTLQKWNRIVPVTTVEVDLPKSYYKLMNEMRVDVFTSNCGYRDVYINSAWEWDSNPDNNNPGWEMLSKYYEVPLLVGEYGMHEQDKETAARPDWVNQQLKSMITNKEKGGVGYLYFEWNEEHLKPPNQQDMGIIRFAPNTANGKDSTKKGDLVADLAIEKDVIFEAAKQGLEGSAVKDWNYMADVYQLTETTQLTVDLDTIPVRPFPYTRETPPTIPGFTPLPDEDPEMICFGFSSKDPNLACSGHGTCIATNFCSCNSGYSGEQCATARYCFGKMFNDEEVCSGHGSCTSQDSCACSNGYSGSQCTTARKCFGKELDDPSVCSGHGSCTDTDECTCSVGYMGTQCATRDPSVPDSSLPEESIVARPSESASASISIIALTVLVALVITPMYMWLY